MHINIRGRDQYNREGVDVADGLTVAELRTQLTREFNINAEVESLRLIYRGRLLQDTNALSFYNIEDGSTVHVVVQNPHAEDATGSTGSNTPQQSNPGMWSQQILGAGTAVFPWNVLAPTVTTSIANALQQHQHQQQSTASQSPPNPFTAAGAGGAAANNQQDSRTFTFSATTDSPGTTAPSNTNNGGDHIMPQQLGSQISSIISTAITNAMDTYAATGQSPQQPPQPQSPQPPQPQTTSAAAAAGRRSVDARHVPPSCPPAVVHIHVHCTPDQLAEMPARLRQLAAEISVSRVDMHSDPVDLGNEVPHANPPPQTFDGVSLIFSQPPQAPPPAANARRMRTWVKEALQAATTSFDFVEFCQLHHGNLQAVSRLREPLQQQLQSRLSNTGNSAAAMMQLVQQETIHLHQCLVHMPRMQQLVARSRNPARNPTTFQRELMIFLEHLLLSLMQHVRQNSLSEMEWSRGLRNLVARYVGMAMSRSALWFEEGSAGLRPVIVNAAVQLARTYSLHQPMAEMLGPAVQASLDNWQREYEETAHRSIDAMVFEQPPQTQQQQQREGVGTPNMHSAGQSVQAQDQPAEQDLEELAKELLNEGVEEDKGKDT